MRDTRQVRQADSGVQPLLVLPQRPQGHQSEALRRRHAQADRQWQPSQVGAVDRVALTAPYLHDGSARTLEEIWTVYNPEDKHGRTNDLTKDELNDLIEYLRTR